MSIIILTLLTSIYVLIYHTKIGIKIINRITNDRGKKIKI